jgi:hypothetical protein
MTDADEIVALRATLIGGKTWPDDYTVIWRTLPIGRIMLAPGLPPHVAQWRWTCNFYGKPADASDRSARHRVILITATHGRAALQGPWSLCFSIFPNLFSRFRIDLR